MIAAFAPLQAGSLGNTLYSLVFPHPLHSSDVEMITHSGKCGGLDLSTSTYLSILWEKMRRKKNPHTFSLIC